jgi:hypothetical protein
VVAGSSQNEKVSFTGADAFPPAADPADAFPVLADPPCEPAHAVKDDSNRITLNTPASTRLIFIIHLLLVIYYNLPQW